MKIADLMASDPCCIQSSETLRAAHRLMRALGVRHLPVLRGR
jgi:CBS domain-containing protein